jgi:hypothetical protein
MISFIEPLYKSQNSILFAWNPEPGALSYNIYVGINSLVGSMVSLFTKINPTPGNSPAAPGKIAYKVNIVDVQTALSLASGDFSDTTFYFAVTYNNPTDSGISNSRIVKIPPVGIVSSYMKDDPTTNRHPFVFSNDIESWVKAAGSSYGATIVDSADFYKSNITIDYTYDGTNLATVKSYPSDSTSSGLPAKLTTYTYSGGKVIKIQITDSTV